MQAAARQITRQIPCTKWAPLMVANMLEPSV